MMRIQFSQAAFLRQDAVLRAGSPRPNLLFTGLADELEVNRKKSSQQYYADFISKNAKILRRPLVKVGERSLNGLELLDLIRELGQKSTWTISSGDYEGTKTVWFFEIKSLLYPPEMHDKGSDLLKASMDSLIALECMKLETQSNNVSSDRQPGRWYVYLTPKGTRAVEEAKRLNWLKCLDVPEEKMAETPGEKSEAESGKALEDSASVAQFRFLIAKQVDGLSGWEVLQKLAKVHNKRGWLARFFMPGLTPIQWRQRSDFDSPKAFRNLINRFVEFGLIAPSGKPEADRWVLTPLALDMASCSDPSKAIELDRDDLKLYFKGEIEALETRKKGFQQQLQTRESEYANAARELETTRTRLDKLKQEVLKAYPKAKAEQNEKKAAARLEEISEKLMEIDLLTQEVQMKEEQLQQRKGHEDAAKVFFSKWRQQTHQRIQKFQQLIFQLESKEITQGITDLLAEMQELDAQQQAGNDSLSHLMNALTESVQINYQLGKDTAQEANLGEKLNAERAYQSMQLDAAIAKLLAEQSSSQSAPASSGESLKVDGPELKEIAGDSVRSKGESLD